MLLKQVERRFVFTGGRHRGKELNEVAKENPEYLQWLFNSLEVNQDLSDEAWYALEDSMREHKIPFAKKRKRKLASQHGPHRPQSV